MKPDTHYQILEIEPNATQDDIRQAYKDLVTVWHPDRFFDNPRLRQKAEEKLKRINAAYDFLKSYQFQTVQDFTEPTKEQSDNISINCEKLEKFLKLGELKVADCETKRLLLELASREKEGWLRPEDVRGLSPLALSAIDKLWTHYSNGCFGFSIQSRLWRKLGCSSSDDTTLQTISENKFGQATRWRVGSMWVSPWDTFSYDLQSPLGSFPREYIFALSGWWSYSQGWTGYLLWRFDEIFLKL